MANGIDTASVANTIRPYFNKQLLKVAEQELHLAEYAQTQELPAGAGAKSVTFFRPDEPNLKAVGAPKALTEGVAPTERRKISYTPIEVTLTQIGQVTEVTDIADAVGLFNYLKNAITIMGGEFAMDVESRIRDILANPDNGFIRRYATKADGTPTTDFAALKALTGAEGIVKPVDLLDSMTQLKVNRAPKIGGGYVGYFSAAQTRDMLNDKDWKDVIKSQNADKVFKGEIGQMSNCRIVEGTLPMRESAAEGTYDENGAIYTAFVLGKDAYGTIDMKKLGSAPKAKAPTIIINDKADKIDPLNQYILAGWKAYWASVALYKKWGIALRTRTNFVGV